VSKHSAKMWKNISTPRNGVASRSHGTTLERVGVMSEGSALNLLPGWLCRKITWEPLRPIIEKELNSDLDRYTYLGRLITIASSLVIYTSGDLRSQLQFAFRRQEGVWQAERVAIEPLR
jgi:hypothetical protein